MSDAGTQRHLVHGTHNACRVFKSAVDELIAEVAAEERALQGAADAFACGLLVEAVASSQGKFDFAGERGAWGAAWLTAQLYPPMPHPERGC